MTCPPGIDPRLWDAVLARAQAEGRTVAEWLTRALEHALARGFSTTR